MIEHYKNLSLENLREEIDGILYEEQWKDIAEWNGYYQVSNFGRIKSLRRQSFNGKIWFWQETKIRVQGVGTSGYLFVPLCKNGIAKNRMTHRLVAQAFIQNTENKREVNHKDFVKYNNFFTNLEWNTPQENQLHTMKHGRRKIIHMVGENNKIAVFTEVKVLEARKFYAENKGKVSVRKMARDYGVNNMTLDAILKRRTWTHI